MRIGVIGINHKSADVELRESFAKACQRRFGAECSTHGTVSYVLLSTCNRTEIYFSTHALAETHTYILGILRNDISEEFEHKMYSYFGSDCFFHLARVTSGFDSAIIGETEIQGQVKCAYESALKYRILSKEMHFLFQKCLKIGKEMRNSKVAGCMASLEETIVNLSYSLLGDLAHRQILFVGVSEINCKIFKRFKQKKLNRITFCNRSLQRAQALAESENIHFLPWEELCRYREYDLIIFGTKSPDFLIRKENFHFRSSKRQVIMDLCVPRNVDPKIGKMGGITLLNVDQLSKANDRNKKIQAAKSARLASQMLTAAIEKQMEIFRAKVSRPEKMVYTFAS